MSDDLKYPHEHEHMAEHFSSGHVEHVTDIVPKTEISQGYSRGDPDGGEDGEIGGDASDE